MSTIRAITQLTREQERIIAKQLSLTNDREEAHRLVDEKFDAKVTALQAQLAPIDAALKSLGGEK